MGSVFHRTLLLSLILYYISFGLGTLAGSSFLYSVVIFSQGISTFPGFSGLVFLSLFLPFPFFFLWTGSLLDRYAKKWVLFAFQLLFLVATAFLYFGIDLLQKQPILLLIPCLCNGLGMTLVLPGRMAFLRDLTEHHRLVFHTISSNLLLIGAFGLSPLFVGFFLEGSSFSFVFLILSLMHFLSLFFLFFVKPHSIKKNPTASPRIGFVVPFLQKDTVSLQIIFVTVLAMFALGPIQVVLPKYLKEVLGLGELARGTALVAFGPGLFLGGMGSVLFHHAPRKGQIILYSLLVSNVFFLFLVSTPAVWVTSLFLFLFGISGGVLSSLLPAVLQHRAPDQVRGRVLSLYMVCFQFTPAVSGFLSSFLADAFGFGACFLGMGAFLWALGSLSWLFFRELRSS